MKTSQSSSNDPAGLFLDNSIPSMPSKPPIPAVDTHKSQDEINRYIEKYTIFKICDFNDECDSCGNPNHKQSWAKMSGYPEEADYYICEDCILKNTDTFKELI